MRALWLANGVNILLNPCLIFGLGPFPRMGLLGSAVGTTIGRSAGVAYQLWNLSSGSGRIRIRWSDLRLRFGVMARLFRLSLAATFQFLVQMSSWLGAIRIIASFGSAAVAAYTISVKIVIFAILPSWA